METDDEGWLQYSVTTRKSKKNPKEVVRPLILDMGIIEPNTGVDFVSDMLVDSGAFQTLVDWQVGLALKIDLDSCPERDVIGITGEGTKGRAAIVRMIFPRETKEHLLEAIFVKKLKGHGLLGAQFFEQFHVEFEQYNNRFRIIEKQELNWPK